MGYTLYDIVQRVAREIGVLIEGTATGGSSTTIIDTVYLANRYGDDHFNAGQGLVLYDAAGAAAAPQGEWGRITDFVSSTGVVTITALTTAVAAGDRYGLIEPRFTLDDIIQAINRALGETPIENTDITSVTTDSETLEYSLPTTIIDQNIEVWIQRVTDDANANYWIRYDDWYIQSTATGTAKLLVFRSQPDYDYALKLVYRTYHPPLYARTDKLNEAIDVNRIAMEAAYKCLEALLARRGVNDPVLEKRLGELGPRVFAAEARAPIEKSTIKYFEV